MAVETPVLILNQIAGEDFSTGGGLSGYMNSGQFLIVKQNDARVNDTVVHCNSVKSKPRGIIQNNPLLAQAAAVMTQGLSKVIAGAPLSAGDEFGTNALGQAVRKNVTATGANYGDYAMGEVIQGVDQAGELATVLIASPYRI